MNDFEKDDQMNTAGGPIVLAPETLLDRDPGISTEDLPKRSTEDLVLIASQDQSRGSWHNQVSVPKKSQR